MPVDSGMIPFAQPLFPFRASGQGMIDGRRRIRAQHPEEVETDTQACPGVVTLERHDEEYDAEGDPHEDAASMAPCVPKLFLMCVSDCHGLRNYEKITKKTAKLTIFMVGRIKKTKIWGFLLSSLYLCSN